MSENIKAQIENTLLRKQAFIVANWLEGTLSGLSSGSSEDDQLVGALHYWLHVHQMKTEEFLVGTVRCGSCGKQWDASCFASRRGRLQCPSCGEKAGG